MAPKSVKAKPAKAASTAKKTKQIIMSGTKKPKATTTTTTKNKENKGDTKAAPKLTDEEKEQVRKEISRSIEERLNNVRNRNKTINHCLILPFLIRHLYKKVNKQVTDHPSSKLFFNSSVRLHPSFQTIKTFLHFQCRFGCL